MFQGVPVRREPHIEVSSSDSPSVRTARHGQRFRAGGNFVPLMALALNKGIFHFNAILGEASYLFMSHLGLLFVGNSDVWSIVHIVTGPPNAAAAAGPLLHSSEPAILCNNTSAQVFSPTCFRKFALTTL